MVEKREIESLVRKHIESKFSSRKQKEYIVAANWKMNMSSKETRRFIEKVKEEKIPDYLKTVIFPQKISSLLHIRKCLRAWQARR